jgi:hypothetical protein
MNTSAACQTYGPRDAQKVLPEALASQPPAMALGIAVGICLYHFYHFRYHQRRRDSKTTATLA